MPGARDEASQEPVGGPGVDPLGGSPEQDVLPPPPREGPAGEPPASSPMPAPPRMPGAPDQTPPPGFASSHLPHVPPPEDPLTRPAPIRPRQQRNPASRPCLSRVPASQPSRRPQQPGRRLNPLHRWPRTPRQPPMRPSSMRPLRSTGWIDLPVPAVRGRQLPLDAARRWPSLHGTGPGRHVAACLPGAFLPDRSPCPLRDV